MFRNFILCMMLCVLTVSAPVFAADDEQGGARANPWELVLVADDGALVVEPGLQKAQWKALPNVFEECVGAVHFFSLAGHYYALSGSEEGMLCALLSFDKRDWTVWEDKSVCVTEFEFDYEQSSLFARLRKDDLLYEWQAEVEPDFTLSWKITKDGVCESQEPEELIKAIGIGNGSDENWAALTGFYADGWIWCIARNKLDATKYKVSRWKDEEPNTQETVVCITCDSWNGIMWGGDNLSSVDVWTDADGEYEFMLLLIETDENRKAVKEHLYHIIVRKETCTEFFPELWKGRLLQGCFANRQGAK